MGAVELELPKGARLACVGRTGTGKSVMARSFFNASEGRRRIVIDPNDDPDITVGNAGARTPELERWPTTRDPRPDFRRSHTWRVVPAHPTDQKFYDALYEYLFEIGDMLIWLDEAFGPTNSHQAPDGLMRVLFQGRKRKISHIACAQRPVGVFPGIWAQAERWAIFKLPTAQDRKLVAASASLSLQDFDAYHSMLGDYGFMWRETPTERLIVVPQGLPLRDLRAEPASS